MRKKIFTSLVVGALAAACALSFTACGSKGIPSGEEVDADGWKAAFEATLKATNYTVENTSSSSSVATLTEDGTTKTYTEKESTSGTAYVTEDSIYTQSEMSMKTTGAALLDEDEEDIDATAVREVYYTVKESVLWSCVYSEYNYKQGAPEEEETEEPKWSAHSNDFGTAELAKAALASSSGLTYILNGSYSTTKDGSSKALVELYEAFTYSSGKYAATLYRYDSEYTIELSIKGGYIVGLSISQSEEESEEDHSSKYETSTVYVFKNYDKTTVNAPSGATEAINAAQAE